jgi:hypothetical protein
MDMSKIIGIMFILFGLWVAYMIFKSKKDEQKD